MRSGPSPTGGRRAEIQAPEEAGVGRNRLRNRGADLPDIALAILYAFNALSVSAYLLQDRPRRLGQ